MIRLNYEHFKQTCQERNLKPTVQRFVIYETLVEGAQHPTADFLFEQVKKKLPVLARDTVYRTLNSLVEMGLVRKLTMPGGATHFDGDVSTHHHFLCQSCNHIYDLNWFEFNRLPWPEAALRLGRPNQASVLITGVCRGCDAAASISRPKVV